MERISNRVILRRWCAAVLWAITSGSAHLGCSPGSSTGDRPNSAAEQREPTGRVSVALLSLADRLVVGQSCGVELEVRLVDGRRLDVALADITWVVSDPGRLEVVADQSISFTARAPGTVSVYAEYGEVRSEPIRLTIEPIIVRQPVEGGGDDTRGPQSLLSSDGRFDDGEKGGWTVHHPNGRIEFGSKAARIEVDRPGRGDHVQLRHAMPLVSGKTYTLCFHGRANPPRPIEYRIEGLPPERKPLTSGYRGEVRLTDQMQAFEIRLRAIQSEPTAALSLFFGRHDAIYELDDIGVYPGEGCGNPRGLPEAPLKGRSYPLRRGGIEPLVVQGSHVLKGGHRVSLSGVSLFWSNSEWGQHHLYNASAVGELKRHWNASIIRIPMAVEAPGGYLERPAENRRRVERVIRAALDHELYVIIDWHAHEAHLHEPGRWPAATEFFTTMAKAFGGHPHVIYEIYNEPYTEDWQEIRPYAQHLVDAIRAVDPDNLIIAPSPQHATLPNVACADPLDGQNIAYSLHFYAGTHGAVLRALADRTMEAGCAIFVSEYGLSAADGEGAPDRASYALWSAWLETRGISHAAWALSRKDEGASLLDPAASPVGGWRYDSDHDTSDLSEAGVIVREAMLDWNGGRLGGHTAGPDGPPANPAPTSRSEGEP